MQLKQNYISSALDSVLKPLGFKKKGSVWSSKNDQLLKIVKLQKSKFADKYQINYGYIINELPLENLTMHVFNQFTSTSPTERETILNLLTVGNDSSAQFRQPELEDLLRKNLASNLIKINSISDLNDELIRRPQLNDIPVTVKTFLQLNIKTKP